MRKDDQKQKLIKLYESRLSESIAGGFYMNLYDAAIHRLKAGDPPVKVERWVVEMFHLWLKML